MNSAILLIPLFLIRYGLLSLVNRKALPRAAHFPPMQGIEKKMYILYQASTLYIIVDMFFLNIREGKPWLYIGFSIYILGILLFIFSVVGFARPDKYGICRSGLFRISRNPMYVAYGVYFLGFVVLTQSILLFLAVLVFQISSHWVILAEERWCTNQFGKEYSEYLKQVRRYF
ncbi:methyltransferase family protein [Clostridium merdae]|uniref:methyltransferase family protein n=1 Tax=Clostridium merdae TaxID=1958780 RepID=UPI000A2683D6|nr:isoprenylcysteine carboxylmethyltransferase family protein [Clostridium merdae]